MEMLTSENKYNKGYGYIFSQSERDERKCSPNSPARVFLHTDEFVMYLKNARKIAMLLIFSEMSTNQRFRIDDKILFSEMGRIAYEKPELKIMDMQIDGESVLREQAIVAIVSNWETYFSNIFRRIIDDDIFILKSLESNNKFGSLLKKMRLISEFQESVVLNGNNFTGLNFGTKLINGRKINFQDKNIVKKLLKTLTDINITNLSLNWIDISKLIEARHIIIHQADDSVIGNSTFNDEITKGLKTINSIFTKQRLEAIMRDMSDIIEHIDMELFDRYSFGIL